MSCGFVWRPQFEKDDLVRDERGGLKLTEYALILAFVVIALLVAVLLVRQRLQAR